MWNPWTIGLIGAIVMLAAVPYVARIRHPEQKPFAAYLIFATVFLAAAFILFNVLAAIIDHFALADDLREAPTAAMFLALVFIPAFALAAWQARKAPFGRPPPH
ncbi:MAG: hypothetical protein PVF57_17620 [Pseudomonadales bacterium]|jgi:hypothetical protein